MRITFFGNLILWILILNGCSSKTQQTPPIKTPPPYWNLPLNGNLDIIGEQQTSKTNDSYQFTEGILGKCLDLSATSSYRHPFEIPHHILNEDSLQQITISTWIKTSSNISNPYGIIGSLPHEKKLEKGWLISIQPNGAWQWEISDGKRYWRYSPTAERQNLNDKRWHHLAFSLDKEHQEARLYFDGQNVAIYSLYGLDSIFTERPFMVGGSPCISDKEMDCFPGYLDQTSTWNQVLKGEEIFALYHQGNPNSVKKTPVLNGELKLMAWNIWHGGRHCGRDIGVERVISMIKKENPDIITMVETYGSGEHIADALGYYFYLRSSNLSVMSRFPIQETHNLFRPFNFGCCEVALTETQKATICPLWIHYLPDYGSMVKKGIHPDTLVQEEWKTRGKEIKQILREMKPFIAQSDKQPVIIAGDFNSGSHLDWTKRNAERYYDMVVPFPASKQMEETAFKDSFRELYPDEVSAPGQTWSPIFKEALQDRIDYIYYKGASLKAEKSWVIDTHPIKFPSDHAAVVTTFSLTKSFNQ